MSIEEDVDIKELFYDIFDIVKFELQFYKDKESPMFEKIIKTRTFQGKLKKLQNFIFNYFELMYKSPANPIKKEALRTQLNNIARITNYYDNLSSYYNDRSSEIITKEELIEIIDFSHIETLFLIFTNILDWEHQKRSVFFSNDETKGQILKEFLETLAKSDIKSMENVVDLEEKFHNLPPYLSRCTWCLSKESEKGFWRENVKSSYRRSRY